VHHTNRIFWYILPRLLSGSLQRETIPPGASQVLFAKLDVLNCNSCEGLDWFWKQLAGQLPPGKVWQAMCGDSFDCNSLGGGVESLLQRASVFVAMHGGTATLYDDVDRSLNGLVKWIHEMVEKDASKEEL
tara:strand:+ start:399 stop:791 length:393 start_codon:yes stop_codon:yes gene_type:complete